MNFSYPYLLIHNNDNIRSKLSQPLLHTQRIKYTCFDASKQYLVFGATSGGLYVFKRHPCEFIQLIPYQEGVISKICISPNEKIFAFTSLKGVICIFEYNGVSMSNNIRVYREHMGATITAIKWNMESTEVYVGDNLGKLSVVTLTDFIAKTMFQTPCFVLMNLDSQIVQLDFCSNLLLISTLTRSYICDTIKEQYRQIGRKLRDGEYGACFLNYNIKEVPDSPISNVDNNQKKRTFSSVTNSEDTFINLKCYQHLKIFCARPGFRFWEVRADGIVMKTHQYKFALAVTPSKLITLDNMEDGFSANVEKYVDRLQSFNFSKLLVLNNRFLLIFHIDRIYILDPEKSSLVLWANCFKNIIDICVVNNNLYIWREKGSIDVILFVELENFILRCFINKQYHLCAKLCIENLEYLTHTLCESTKLHLLVGLEDKLLDNITEENKVIHEKLRPLLKQIKNYSDLRSNAQKSKNGIFIVDNAHFTETQLSNLKSSEIREISMEAVDTIKELSSTVSDKLVNSKKSLKEKWQIFEEKIKTMGVDVSQSDLDLQNTHSETTEEINNSVSELPLIVPLETQIPTLLITKENKKIDPDIITLYEYYKLSRISKVTISPGVDNLIAKHKTVNEFYCFLHHLKTYMDDNNCAQGSVLWCYNLFLQFLNLQNSEKSIALTLADCELKQYLINAFTETNFSSKYSCECNFPLPEASKNNIIFEKIGWRVITLLWKIDPDRSLNICKKVPYMWKYIISLQNDVLNLLMQYNDAALLESFLSNKSDVRITDIIETFIILKHDKCLNCTKINAGSSRVLISWSMLCTILINHFGNMQTVEALLRYAEIIPPGELDYTFYQLCIVSSAFTKKDVDFKQKFFDLNNSVLSDEKAAVKLEQMVENILLRRSETSKINRRTTFSLK